MGRMLLGLLLGWFAGIGAALADHDDLNRRMAHKQELSHQDWGVMENRLALLNNISYLPSLLPIIMQNRDSLELTKGQVASLRQWRRENYQRMVNTMNTIITKRILLAQKAVDPETDPQQLVVLQDELFRLQREVFMIRLSCRQLITESFTQEQWANFAFVAAEDPKFAGLMAQ